MRGIITAAVCAAVASVSFAQQDPQFTQYMFDRLSLNPAVAGTTGQLCGTLLLRQQWSGFDGAPRTALFNAHMPIRRISSGVGLSVYLDELGQQKSTFARLSYAFHRKLGTGTVGIGLSAGMVSHTLGNDWEPIDPVANDNSIPPNGNSDMGWDVGAGLYYVNPTLWLGISTTHLTEVELANVSIETKRHWFVQGGYDWAINGNKNYVLQPSFRLENDSESTQVDITGTFLYNNMVWLGVSYRIEDAVAPLIGYQFKPNSKSMLRIGYSYDVTTSQLANYSSGSHEVMLNYCVLIVKPPDVQIYRNVRFL